MTKSIDLGDGREMTVTITDEGLILDLYDDGDHIATTANTYDELADQLTQED